MVDYGKKWCHFSLKGICCPKANNWGECLFLFAAELLIGEEWSSLFTLLNTGFMIKRCYWKPVKTLSNKKILSGKVAENNFWWSKAFLPTEHFSLARTSLLNF